MKWFWLIGIPLSVLEGVNSYIPKDNLPAELRDFIKNGANWQLTIFVWIFGFSISAFLVYRDISRELTKLRSEIRESEDKKPRPLEFVDLVTAEIPRGTGIERDAVAKLLDESQILYQVDPYGKIQTEGLQIAITDKLYANFDPSVAGMAFERLENIRQKLCPGISDPVNIYISFRPPIDCLTDSFRYSAKLSATGIQLSRSRDFDLEYSDMKFSLQRWFSGQTRHITIVMQFSGKNLLQLKWKELIEILFSRGVLFVENAILPSTPEVKTIDE